MIRSLAAAALVASLALAGVGAHAAETGDAARGARVFRACAACHALEPDRNLTGPSLAGIWERHAASVPSFSRYSPALKSADVVWDAKTLDPWLKDPARFIPENRMTFPGIKDDHARSDLIAFLAEASKPGAAPPATGAQGQGGAMGGMIGMGQQAAPNLKKLEPEDRVKSIAYCRDTYRVTTADGEEHVFWERNLRFKTDSSEVGPEKDAPAIVGAGMMGDRASVIFAAPDEISASVKPGC
jgi:cytochrome c